ncbi:hypothetical protein [Mycetocola zhujimingii]|uniref:Uncharacterized protein n=1 Tax=Mycetocola zhujimingii TaxID=2079792 RepID=A0A2U1TCH3_9MICO|nr:hypothetical protein [Mycetocola zhujimingii]PWC06576.1 hypothetical protein DF223_10765 [Mycetocola zhujimingii]
MDPFWSTLIATIAGSVVGAAAAGGVAWVVFRRESRQNYEARLDEALAGIVLAIPARVRELDAYQDQLDELDRQSPTRNPNDDPLPPGPYELSVRLEATRMVARNADARTLGEVASAFYSVVNLPPIEQRARLSQLPELIRKWRLGELGKQPWTAFTRFAFDVDRRAGTTPPPPWDPMGRVVTKHNQSGL